MRTAVPIRRIALGFVAGVTFVLTATSASAVPTAANVQIHILVGTGSLEIEPPRIANGGTANVSDLNFVAGFLVVNAGPEMATVTSRFELPTGLRWGADGPDPAEDCTVGEMPECEAALDNSQGGHDRSGWGWNVVAERAGSYTLKAQVVESSTSDPDSSDNTASVTVVVTESAGGGGSGATATASAVKLSPARPKAGSLVSATVRVTAGGAPIRPTGIACRGTIGSTKLKSTPKAASGSATCVYRTPRAAKGKTLRGTMSFSARGTKFTKRFSAKLG
ncbi:MAG: hypothetical protein ACRDPV_04440 [Gaiellaceae bacterium]